MQASEVPQHQTWLENYFLSLFCHFVYHFYVTNCNASILRYFGDLSVMHFIKAKANRKKQNQYWQGCAAANTVTHVIRCTRQSAPQLVEQNSGEYLQ